MIKQPVTLVFGADLLAKYPTLVPEPDGHLLQGDYRLEIPAPLGNPSLETLFDDSTAAPLCDISLAECQLHYPMCEIHTLQQIRDDPHTSPTRARRAAEALSRLAHLELSSPRHIKIGGKGPESGQIFLSNLPERRIEALHSGIAALPLHLPTLPADVGIRYLLAPKALCQQFVSDGRISEAEFLGIFPTEPPLQPNEYVVLYRADYCIDDTPRRLSAHDDIVLHAHLGPEHYSDVIARYHAGEHALLRLRYLAPGDSTLPRDTPALAAYYDALRDPAIDSIVVIGPAGSGKTFSAFACARESCISGQFIHTIVLKEGRSLIGAVKGGVEAKMTPMVEYGRDALRSAALKTKEMQKKLGQRAKFGAPELTEEPEEDAEHRKKKPRQEESLNAQLENIVNCQWERNFTSVPYEYAQGRTFDHCMVLIDEAQRIPADLLDTLLTRPGQSAKVVVMGDYAQTSTGQDPETSGLAYASRLLAGSDSTVRLELSTVLRSNIAATVVQNRLAARRALGLPT